METTGGNVWAKEQAKPSFISKQGEKQAQNKNAQSNRTLASLDVLRGWKFSVFISHITLRYMFYEKKPSVLLQGQ